MSSMSKIIMIPELGILSGEALSVSNKRNADSFGYQMQSTLVPPLSDTAACVEAHGRSVPKDDLGGDLMDLVANGDEATAYVADVSGHGFRAGVLMGMLKTAVRYGLLLGQPLTKLLDDLNRLLPAVKEPHMFATLAALRFDGGGVAEYVSAGHVPLLHYRRSTREVVQYCVPQLPLGLLAVDGYTSTNIPYEPGDIFALVSDGVLDRGEDPDQQAGLDRIAKLLRNNADAELCDLVELIRADIGSCGIQQDDETILLLKAREHNATDPQKQSPKPEREFTKSAAALESTWHRLLDDLAEELSHE
jgi:serine phosphatase RsbU (regulator of sigma subunit)